MTPAGPYRPVPRHLDMDVFILGWACGLISWTTAMLFIAAVM